MPKSPWTEFDVGEDVLDVGFGGFKAVEEADGVAFFEEAVGEVRAEEAGAKPFQDEAFHAKGAPGEGKGRRMGEYYEWGFVGVTTVSGREATPRSMPSGAPAPLGMAHGHSVGDTLKRELGDLRRLGVSRRGMERSARVAGSKGWCGGRRGWGWWCRGC